GTWRWAEEIPGLGVPDGNPPSGAASGYVFFDIAALALAPWLLLAWAGVTGRLRGLRDGRGTPPGARPVPPRAASPPWATPAPARRRPRAPRSRPPSTRTPPPATRSRRSRGSGRAAGRADPRADSSAAGAGGRTAQH